MSWWNKKRQPVKTIKIKPTLGNKLTKEYKKKLKIKRRGKQWLQTRYKFYTDYRKDFKHAFKPSQLMLRPEGLTIWSHISILLDKYMHWNQCDRKSLTC